MGKRLKKQVCMVVLCVLTMVTLLVGSVSNYYAIDYNNATWQTVATSPSDPRDSVVVSVYRTNETYQWKLTSIYAPSGYGTATLSGYNCNINILNGGATLSTLDPRNFLVLNFTTNETYAKFKVTMNYDRYPVSLNGYIKILNNQ